ncbi:efflux transporter outer membrane subunit [Marinobacterium mangrovicola]|uniref:Multidrug efflux system outer membrane protein n=1 Tax=Marinobacterium mangrovicola TaxID=1476959 RepID=A0A4R1H7M2_9GAMM|nr:efflux transporter outer membrane subunit [Marinobacterium mangrovicola]TCK16461.1 multidrug efflux system outer membrane protein [Marinobacterium mangrovicola]
MMMIKPLPVILAAALLGGCSLAPDYLRPEAQSINEWQSADQSGQVSSADTGWRDLFADPAMQQVVDLALDNNQDLQIALLNVERYQAQYRIQRSELFPSISADGGGTRQRIPTTYSGAGESSISSQYSATVGLTSYELDLFGRVRSLKQQALEEFLAQQQTQLSTQLTLVANVANAYLNLVADNDQLKLAMETRDIEADNLDLVEKRYNLGVASELELSQARASYEDAEVRLAQYQRLTKLDRNALTLLVGTQLPQNWTPSESLQSVAIGEVQAGLTSELINRRPDILAAEYQLRGANANIGAAKAAFFPSISLTANAGTMSSDLDNLFDHGSDTWLFAPSISLPIFNAGRLSAQLDTSEIDRDIALAQYQQSIQTAFTEVSDAIAERDGYAQQLQSQQRAEEAYQRYFEIAEQRYRNGVDSMLTRLDAQRNLVSSQQASITARLSLLQSRVDLYRALGGGWKENTETAATPTADAAAQ